MKIVCIGRNYAAHVRELNNAMPDEPVIFIKPDTAVLRNNAPFFIPEFTRDVHHEIEVVVKINKNGKAIPVQFAADYYDEITVGIDFTARDLQSKLKEKGLPWEKAKGFDHSAVIGKFIPKTGLDMKNLDFHLTQNGETVQKGNTQMMMHSVDEVIAHVSQYFMLKTGDLIFTGTPEGVGPVSKGDELKGLLGDMQLFRCGVR
ncbi:MAG: fumarylacetoacetate hydrolase family protein [Sphingomonadales bacterium]|nr:fumarylacetoacetate hydrolase family protein [Sphingomonadales bacterium]